MIRRSDLAAVAAGALIALGALILAVAVHDNAMSEDLTTLWVCSLSGNGICGPDTPAIQAEPINFLYGWDHVYHYYLG